MEQQKKRTLGLVASIVTMVAAVAGFVLIGLLSVLNTNGVASSFSNVINDLIQFFKNIASITPANIGGYLTTLLVAFLFVVTFITGLVFIIKLIVDVANYKKEGNNKRAVYDSLKLSFTLLIFYGMLVFFTYFKDAADYRTPAIGTYIALGLGGLGALASAVNYFAISEKPTVNKVLRACLMVVAFAASILALIPTITVEGMATTPAVFFLLMIQNAMNGSMGPETLKLLIAAAVMFVALTVGSSLLNAAGTAALDERKDKNKNTLIIVLSVVAAILVAGAFFGAPLIDSTKSIVINVYSYIALGAAGLAFILAIVVLALAKNEKEAEKPQETAQNEEAQPEKEPEVEQEPAEEEKAEEPQEEKAKVAEAVIIADAVSEDKPAEEEPAKEETQPEEKTEEKQAEEKKAPAKKPSVKKAEPSKKDEPAKKASEKKPAVKKAEPSKKAAEPKKEETKKPAPKKAEVKKEEPKEESKKNTASYHISKRASDNKWQVFRAGSEKVIKLFDTKVEAEEYTKRMAENQGVSYLSHASKGKNKGRIQKK